MTLEEEVKQLRKELDAVLRVLWEIRGQAKGEAGRIEKDLEKPFKEMLERGKIGKGLPIE